MVDPRPERISSLPGLSKIELRELWKQTFKSEVPAPMRRDLMIPILAYKIQEQAFTSLTAASRSRLRRLSQLFESDSSAAVIAVPGIKPGTRLVRQWHSEVHLVNVETNGYKYRGIHYQSLSEIARLITGTRWSGPAFFGLKSVNAENNKKNNQKVKEAA
jgi:hypothetical protein